MPTKTQVVNARPQILLDMVNGWKPFMATEETTAETYRGHVERPGGQPWEGATPDAAIGVARNHHVAVADARDTVDEGVRDIGNTISTELIPPLTNAQQIIANAEAQPGVTVNEDLSITYTPPEGTSKETADRNRQTVADAAQELKEEADKWWAAEQTVQSQITTLRGKLDGTIPPDGAAPSGAPPAMVGPFPVPPEVVAAAQQQPGRPAPGQPAAGQLPPGQLGPFPVPPAVAAAANGLEGAPITKLAGEDSDLGGLLGANDSLEGPPAVGQPGGLPAALSQLPPPPDKATIDRQAAKVETARQTLAAAQSKLDDAAGEGYMQGAGAGPGKDVTNPLSQAVFDARAELTAETRTLNELNYASAAHGGPTVPAAPLPENAHVQAFPPEPPVIERSVDAFADGMKDTSKTVWDATMPDVGNMYHVATDWDNATPEQKTQAGIDAASMLPFPGAKILGEGVEHGLDALGGVARHSDDVPTPHGHVDAPAGGNAPVEHHGHSDTPAEHHAGGDAAGDSHAVADHAAHTGDALANASEAVIDRRKFEGYSMDPSNVNNGGKWQAWQQIGYDVHTDVGRQSAASDVVAQIQSQLSSTPAEALPATKWGERFQVDVPISGPSGDGTLVTVWQVENGVPRMITNFLKVWK